MSAMQNIVILGGGSAGAAVAKDLSAKLNPLTHTLTLVTPRRYFVNLPALVRTSVTSEGELEDLVLMPYGDFMVAPKPHPSGSGTFKGTVKLGKAVSFTSEENGGDVLLEGGEKIPYNVLVLATGNTWNGPLNLPDGDFATAKTFIDEWRAKFRAAKNIVLVGGGAVGIEYAGEIRDFHPQTNVTLVHSQDQLFTSAYPQKFRRAALKRVKRGGVDLVLEDVLEDVEPSAGFVTTKKGRRINADLVIPTWGGRPNTSFIQASLGPDALSKTGHVLVQTSLQVKGYPRIFAVGDIIDWSEQKQAAKVGAHASVVVANILRIRSGSNGAGVQEQYKGSPEMIVVTFGRSGGLAYMGVMWGLVFGDWFARMLKSKGLLIEMIRGTYKFGNYRTSEVKA